MPQYILNAELLGTRRVAESVQVFFLTHVSGCMPGSDARRRFIIFDGPAYDAVRLTHKSPEWHWERFDFSHDELVELERRPSPFLSTLEQAQADEQDAFMDAEDDHGQLDANDLASSEDLSGDAVADADTAPVRSVIRERKE